MSQIEPVKMIPAVGDGATFRVLSDSHAYTVIAVSKSGNKVTLQRDKATLLNGVKSDEPDALQFDAGGFCGHTSGTQRYSFERDLKGSLIVVSRRMRPDGTMVWKQVGCATTQVGFVATFGERREHYDFNL